MNMVYNKATGTVIILDNSTTGMTGHQDHPATGKTVNMVNRHMLVDLVDLCQALGVKHVEVVDAFDVDKLAKVVKRRSCKR